MNIIKSFNNTIDYFETVLDDEIDEKKVTQFFFISNQFSELEKGSGKELCKI